MNNLLVICVLYIDDDHSWVIQFFTSEIQHAWYIFKKYLKPDSFIWNLPHCITKASEQGVRTSLQFKTMIILFNDISCTKPWTFPHESDGF